MLSTDKNDRRSGAAGMNSVPKLTDAPTRQEPETIDTFDARDLITSGDKVRIVLDGQTYFLRITRAGKLILTK